MRCKAGPFTRSRLARDKDRMNHGPEVKIRPCSRHRIG